MDRCPLTVSGLLRRISCMTSSNPITQALLGLKAKEAVFELTSFCQSISQLFLIHLGWSEIFLFP
jgi:hypothetical protein